MRIAIIGGGHAGRALAGYLALYGNEVSLYNRTLDNVTAIREAKGIELTGVIEGFAHLDCVSDDMAEVVLGRDIIIVTIPAHAHRDIAFELCKWVGGGQTILLMPGATGGAIEFSNIFDRGLNSEHILLGEAQTFSFVSRILNPKTVLVSKIKNTVRISALPAASNHKLIQSLSRLPLAFDLAENVLETSLGNVNAMLHPAPLLLSAGLIESQCGGFLHYHDLISESVGTLIERMDQERIEIAKALGINSASLLEWLMEVYDAQGETLCECIKSIDTYDSVGCASSLDHRYILEDIPTGLVPISSIAELVGVPTLAIDSVIDIATQLYQKNFRECGRTVETLGLADMTVTKLQELIQFGRRAISRSILSEPSESLT